MVSAFNATDLYSYKMVMMISFEFYHNLRNTKRKNHPLIGITHMEEVTGNDLQQPPLLPSGITMFSKWIRSLSNTHVVGQKPHVPASPREALQTPLGTAMHCPSSTSIDVTF